MFDFNVYKQLIYFTFMYKSRGIIMFLYACKWVMLVSDFKAVAMIIINMLHTNKKLNIIIILLRCTQEEGTSRLFVILVFAKCQSNHTLVNKLLPQYFHY
jgi:hypothetical protein